LNDSSTLRDSAFLDTATHVSVEIDRIFMKTFSTDVSQNKELIRIRILTPETQLSFFQLPDDVDRRVSKSNVSHPVRLHVLASCLIYAWPLPAVKWAVTNQL